MTAAPEVRNVVIIGSGPAGLTAGIYTSRANLKPLLLCGPMVGGQLTTTTDIENFPGFPEPKGGPELMRDMEEQARRNGAEIEYEAVESIDTGSRPFALKVGERIVHAHAVIVCTGASPRMLGMPFEQAYWNRGVHTCAVCDGGFYKGKEVVVVGGGDTAMEEASYLTKLASKVTVVHRRDSLRASKVMAERALNNPKIAFEWDTVVADGYGDTEGKFPKLRGLVLKNVKTGATKEFPTAAIFMAIGHVPNTGFLGAEVKKDDEGYLIVDHHQQTNVPGLFAAGDVHDRHYRQAITAAGMGCAAALEAERYLVREGLGS